MNKTPVRVISNILGFAIGLIILVVIFGIRSVGIGELIDRYLSLSSLSKTGFTLFIIGALVIAPVWMIVLVFRIAGSSYGKEDFIYAIKCFLITAVLTIVLIPAVSYLAVKFL